MCPDFWYINQSKGDSSTTVTHTGKAGPPNFQGRRSSAAPFEICACIDL